MVYWKGYRFWVGKLAEYLGIMSQGATAEELEENLRDAYLAIIMEDVPDQHLAKEITV